MKLNYLQLWTIVACILLIILASVFFFLSSRISGSDKMEFIKDHPDSIFVTTYKPNSNLIAAKSFQPVNNTPVPKDTVAVKKVDEPNKPAAITNTAVDKNKPAAITNPAVAKNKPVIQRNQKEEEYADIQNITEDQEFDRQSDYSLSNSEIQAILAGEKPEEKPVKATTANNLTQQNQTKPQTSRPVAGTRAFNDYVQKNRRSLTDKDCANQHGKVILVFKVDNSGHPVDIAIFRSLCREADKEAVRLLQNGPDWTASGDNFARCEVTF